jgi:hypothetical protein
LAILNSDANARRQPKIDGAEEAWSVSLKPGCSKNSRLDRRPVLMGFDRGGPASLIAWGRTCAGDVGGPIRRPDSRIEMYYVDLQVMDAQTLRFSVIEGSFMFDKAGKETSNVLSSCIEFTGEARLARGESGCAKAKMGSPDV